MYTVPLPRPHSLDYTWYMLLKEVRRVNVLKFEQVGTVIEPASEYYSGRLTKKERKTTLTEELLSDHTLGEYRYVANMNRSKGSMQLLPTLTDLLRIILNLHMLPRKRKVREIEERNRPGGVDKWKNRGPQSRKRAKQRRH